MISPEMQALVNVCTTQTLLELRQRNEERAKAMIAQMGARHVLHPSNRVQKTQHRGILDGR